MPRKVFYRYHKCDALCGRDMPIPADVAHEVLYPSGDTRPGCLLVCLDCDKWIRKEVEEAHVVYPPSQFWR